MENFQKKSVVIGTAGHIDHGKTALVEALTGTNADRLPEEKRRGITIDLGFAEMETGGFRIAFVDVPGHEKFVKNMLAGASGIDAVALIVAADEGVMPQTREHFAICRLLDVKKGLVVITKSDLVDDELLEIVNLDIAELVTGSFLENAPVIAVSAKNGANLSRLKEIIEKIAAAVPLRTGAQIARLPIDRAFAVKGFGAVVTGTLTAHQFSEGDELELLPAAKKVRVRGLQTHGAKVSAAFGGQRTAVNPVGVEHGEIERGWQLAPFGKLRPTQMFNAAVEVLGDAPKSLKSRQRVRVHIGTAEVLARLQIIDETGELAAGEKGSAQIRLESPVVCAPGERFIIRLYSPAATVAGGAVLDNAPVRFRRRNLPETRRFCESVENALAAENKTAIVKIYLESADVRGASFADLQARTVWRDEILREILRDLTTRKACIEAEGVYISRGVFENLRQKTLAEIAAHHRREPLSRGISRETLREKVCGTATPPEIFRKLLQTLVEADEITAEKDVLRVADYSRRLAPNEKTAFDFLQKTFGEAELSPPSLENVLLETAAKARIKRDEARKIFQLLIDGGEVLKISDEFYFSRRSIGELTEKMRIFAREKTTDNALDVAQFKEIAGISRKFAIPLLEYFDREKVTRRVGEKRQII